LEPGKAPPLSGQTSTEPQGLLYILVAAVAPFSGWSLSKLRAPKQESSESTIPQDHTQEEAGRRRFDPSLIHQTAQTSGLGNYTEERTKHTPWERFATLVGTIGLLVVNIGLLVANIYQTKATRRAAEAARQQATLARQQLEGTMRAIVNPGIGIELDRSIVELAPTNEGHVAATNVEIHMQVTKLSVPGLALVGSPLTFTQVIPVIGVTQNPDRVDRPFPVTPDERNAIDNDFRMVVQVKGTLSYNDGFGMWREPICRIRYAIREIKNGQVLRATSSDAIPCKEFRKALPTLLKIRADVLGR
jgi:hypothetical protein